MRPIILPHVCIIINAEIIIMHRDKKKDIRLYVFESSRFYAIMSSKLCIYRT